MSAVGSLALGGLSVLALFGFMAWWLVADHVRDRRQTRVATAAQRHDIGRDAAERRQPAHALEDDTRDNGQAVTVPTLLAREQASAPRWPVVRPYARSQCPTETFTPVSLEPTMW